MCSHMRTGRRLSEHGAMLSDGALGFLYEENTYYPKDSMGYTIIFDRYTIEQITGGKYVPDIKKQH